MLAKRPFSWSLNSEDIMRLLLIFVPLLTISAYGKLIAEDRHEKSLECASQLVQSARKEIRDTGRQTQGVNPTVGIGEAILIFSVVGAISLVIGAMEQEF